MKWNVYYYNVNRNTIETFNIFKHRTFMDYVKQHFENCKDKESFGMQLKSELMYFFWSKTECEIILAPWCGGDRERDAIKIDIYQQVMNNWHVFLDYVWDSMSRLAKLGEKDNE